MATKTEKWCPQKSRFRLAILTKNGYENKYWFSYLSKNKKNPEDTIKKMIARVQNHPKYSKIAQVVIAYDNQTGTEILRHKF